MRTPLTILTLAAAALSVLPAHAEDMTTLYDVGFDAPPHTHGEAPMTGSGPIPRDTISSIETGDPGIRQALFSPTTMTFDASAGGSDIVSFDDAGLPEFAAYVIDIDFAIDLDIGSSPDASFFTVAVDLPDRHLIRFTVLGNIQYIGPGVGTAELIGTWDSVSFRPLQIAFEVNENRLDVTYDGELLTSRTVADIDTFGSLIVGATTTGSAAARAIAQIDRVRIAGGSTTVPVKITTWSDIKTLF